MNLLLVTLIKLTKRNDQLQILIIQHDYNFKNKEYLKINNHYLQFLLH